MARNRVHVEAAPDEVWAVLANAHRYPDWVVGASHVREADEGFPAKGTRFHHAVGMRPATLSDHTEVLEVEPPRRIVLAAKARPLGTARVELVLEPRAGGTEVLMVETPGDTLTGLLAGNPAADALLKLRNAEALSRLKRLVEGHPPGGAGAPSGIELSGARALITGGSSGIGLATACRIAAAGGGVAIVARNEDGLARAADRIAEHGRRPLTISADVADRAAVEEAFGRAVEELGGLDLVVHAAATTAFGPFREVPAEDFDRTVAIVLGGTANTMRAALGPLEESEGALVVVASLAAKIPLPGMSPYVAGKHGVRGLVNTLRAELRESGSPISLSMVHPGPVDTPFWEHVTSATGLLPPMPPSYTAETVAEAVLACARSPRDEYTVGGASRIGNALFSAARGLADAGMAVAARLGQTGGDSPSGPGALERGRGDGRTSGGHRSHTSLAVEATKLRDRASGAGRT